MVLAKNPIHNVIKTLNAHSDKLDALMDLVLFKIAELLSLAQLKLLTTAMITLVKEIPLIALSCLNAQKLLLYCVLMEPVFLKESTVKDSKNVQSINQLDAQICNATLHILNASKSKDAHLVDNYVMMDHALLM